jgi:hypothetical protein
MKVLFFVPKLKYDNQLVRKNKIGDKVHDREKNKGKKMGIFVSMLRHNSDKKTVTENKIHNNVRQYKIGKFLCDVTKYDFWICGVLQVFPLFYVYLASPNNKFYRIQTRYLVGWY